MTSGCEPCPLARVEGIRFRARREQPNRVYGLSPDTQGQNLTLTVLSVPNSVDGCMYGFGFRRLCGPIRCLPGSNESLAGSF